jgi:glycosyltransferase involved in cell wall biosynthesis
VWPAPLQAIARYDKVLCVSRWTAQLAVQRWGRPADVFYPAVRPVAPRPKERLVLTVGRIAAGGTRKGHADLISAFRRLDLDGWRLAVAGAVNYAESSAVIDEWRRDLDGTAVEIVANPTKDQLEELYGRASLYWHGAGFGATSGSIGREHFGISVVEAMSAGAVPLAFEGGGVREIVTDGADGVLWSTLDELIEGTRRLALDDEAMQRLRAAAADRARHFGIEQHDRRVEELLIRPSAQVRT